MKLAIWLFLAHRIIAPPSGAQLSAAARRRRASLAKAPMMMKLMMGAFHLIEEKLPCLLDKFRFAFAENHLQG